MSLLYVLTFPEFSLNIKLMIKYKMYSNLYFTGFWHKLMKVVLKFVLKKAREKIQIFSTHGYYDFYRISLPSGIDTSNVLWLQCIKLGCTWKTLIMYSVNMNCNIWTWNAIVVNG